MSRRDTLQQAAGWALQDNGHAAVPAIAPALASVRATLADPALDEALGAAAAFGRLSDADIRAMRDGRRQKFTGAAAAVLLIVGCGGLLQVTRLHEPSPFTARYETQRGEQRRVALADGSQIELDGATRLDVTIDARQRSVVLRRGEAYFDIAHEAARPFVVTARGSSTRVLGTAFDIDLTDREVKLAVFRGRVRFGASGADTGQTVPAGWRSRFRGGVADVPRRFDSTQQDWRQDWLDTDEMRLGDLVETLNRRGGPVIQAPPPHLADLMLTGRFKLDDPERLLGAIGAAYGFRVARHGAQVRLAPDGQASGAGDAKPSSK